MPRGDELTPERILEGIAGIAFGEKKIRPADRLRALQALAKLTGMGPPTDEEAGKSFVDDL